jgi:hypothetical protein
LLSNADLRKTITKKAWNKMNQSYNWDLVGSKLEKLLKNEPLQDFFPTKDDLSVGLR